MPRVKGKKKRTHPTPDWLARAGLMFPVDYVKKKLKSDRYCGKSVSTTTAVYLTAVMEYIVFEILEAAGKAVCEEAAVRGKENVIGAHHLMLGIWNDDDLSTMLARANIGANDSESPQKAGGPWPARVADDIFTDNGDSELTHSAASGHIGSTTRSRVGDGNVSDGSDCFGVIAAGQGGSSKSGLSPTVVPSVMPATRPSLGRSPGLDWGVIASGVQSLHFGTRQEPSSPSPSGTGVNVPPQS